MSNIIFTISYILIILSFIAGYNNATDPTFTHFTEKQCDLDDNCVYPDEIDTHSILIAVDGTGMRKHFEGCDEDERKYSSPIGVNHNHEWIWKSHVANFWEDYQGEAHYFYGPDAGEMIIAGNEVAEICNTAMDDVCNFIRTNFKNYNHTITAEEIKSMELNEQFGIDIIGYSRGGFAAMEIARRLQYEGCDDIDGNDNIKPIYVRFLGLYDPVQRDIDWGDVFIDPYDNEKIGSNVIAVSVAERSPEIHSRSYFGYAVKGFDEDEDGYPLYRDIKRFDASHAGCGGVPGEGDCVPDEDELKIWDIDERLCNYDLYSLSLDKNESADIDIWIRQHAKEVGVPIVAESDDYYGGFEEYCMV